MKTRKIIGGRKPKVSKRKITKEQYKEALEQAAISAESWHIGARVPCKSHFTCPNTGFQ